MTRPRVERQRFGTVMAELESPREWLKTEGITHAVMESTGSYWKLVFNVLEENLQVCLANPQEVTNRKGHKTDDDDKDGWWLVDHQHFDLLVSRFQFQSHLVLNRQRQRFRALSPQLSESRLPWNRGFVSFSREARLIYHRAIEFEAEEGHKGIEVEVFRGSLQGLSGRPLFVPA